MQLETYSTPQLLKWLHSSRAHEVYLRKQKEYSRQLFEAADKYAVPKDEGTMDEFEVRRSFESNQVWYDSLIKANAKYIDQLKAVLATRPHIPNKQERKAIRQAKARAKRYR